jgi:hypothetical protein
MTSRLAALLAAVFAASVIAPPEGVVVHRHAGGDHVHLHADLASGAHPHAGDVAAHHDDHEHDHAEDHHHHDHDPGDHPAEARHHDDDDQAVGLSAVPGGGVAHIHATPLFHQAVSPPPPALAPPRPLARLGQSLPPVRLALARPTMRSRGPPTRSV